VVQGGDIKNSEVVQEDIFPQNISTENVVNAEKILHLLTFQIPTNLKIYYVIYNILNVCLWSFHATILWQ
jgi:hypothetical protein